MSGDQREAASHVPGELNEETAPSLLIADPEGSRSTVASPDSTIMAGAQLSDGRTLTLWQAATGDAATLLGVIHEAFGSRKAVDPPPAALSETVASIEDFLRRGFGILAEVDGRAAAALLVSYEGEKARLERVSVHPDFQRLGIAGALVTTAIERLAVDGVANVEVLARIEFPHLARWWTRYGFGIVGQLGHTFVMRRHVPLVAEVPTARAMVRLGRRLATVLRAGDVVIASGDLGAGKTTLTQGLGDGMHVGGPIISPTFVLARVHPPLAKGPALVHVDAYRLSSWAEVEDLDLEASLADSVTVVEWGTGIAEGLSSDRLEIDIRRGLDPFDDTRWVFVTPVGGRWDLDMPALREVMR